MAQARRRVALSVRAPPAGVNAPPPTFQPGRTLGVHEQVKDAGQLQFPTEDGMRIHEDEPNTGFIGQFQKAHQRGNTFEAHDVCLFTVDHDLLMLALLQGWCDEAKEVISLAVQAVCVELQLE